ncbi:MAG: methionine biosynthesis protein MetW [Endomicrobiales bacterium]|jgi:methionine biosynthesis protein MetW
MKEIRYDHQIIAGIIERGSKILDLGCGTGELLKYLVDTKNAQVQGIELDEEAIHQCVEKGLSVYHSDIDSGLKGYPDKAFDYVILNQSLQQVKNIDYVIDESLRVGKNVIVGFPNFAYIASRATLFFRGRVPITETLPYEWHNTPNLRFLSINNFEDFCKQRNIKIIDRQYIGVPLLAEALPNLFAESAIFLITNSVA